MRTRIVSRDTQKHEILLYHGQIVRRTIFSSFVIAMEFDLNQERSSGVVPRAIAPAVSTFRNYIIVSYRRS